MKKDIDLSSYFKFNKSKWYIITPEETEKQNAEWLFRPVEERYFAIEFLRAQWIEMNNLPAKMDRSYFEYR